MADEVSIGNARWAVLAAADAYIKFRDRLNKAGDRLSVEGQALDKAVRAWRKTIDGIRNQN